MTTLRKLSRGFTSIVEHWEKWKIDGLLLLKKRLSNSNKVLEVKLKELKNPIYLRNNTSDITVFYQVFFKNSYNFNYSSDVDVVVDCGANIGLASIFFAHLYPKAMIIAVEPEKSNFEMLVTNCSPYKNIIPVKAGVWNKNTNLQLVNKSVQPWEMQVEEGTNQKTDIEAVSISFLVQKFDLKKIDILKIDIEGSEKELFEANAEKWLAKTKILCIKLHDHLREGASQSFFRAISKYEYRMLKREENLVFYFNHYG